MSIKHFKSFFKNTIVRNVIFWTVSFLVLLRLFSRTEDIRVLDVIYTSLFHVPLIAGLILHHFSIKQLLEKKNYVSYIFSFTFGVFFVIQSYFLTFDILADVLFPDFYFIAVYEWFEIGAIGLVYFTLSLLLYLAKGWFRQQEAITKVALLEEEKTASELQALRAQVNPHFLFNSLNTIYGEALKKSDKAPGLILGLSDILRYVVDNMNKDYVFLSDEVQYLKKYIALQKERVNNPDQVRFKVIGDPAALRIAPLLLITFIENCFKHGALSEPSDFVSISLSIEGESLTLQTDNTINIDKQELETSSKTGLLNAQRRLALAYEDKYQLDIQERADHYFLTLTMELSS